MKNLDCYLSNLIIGNIKLHNLHWNVTGLTFKAVHEYLETLYEDSFEKYDEVAELQKQFGLPVLASAKDYLENTSLKELGNAEYSPREAIELAKEYIETMRALALTIREEAQKEDCFVLIWVPRRYAEVIDGTKKQSEYSHCIRSVFWFKRKTGDKPGYVVDDHLSSCAVTGTVEQPTRTVLSRETTDGPPICPVRSCFGWGLHVPRMLPPGRWSLTPPLHPYRPWPAVLFCCTFLGVSSTGRYPASCPLKPGLSSPAAFRLCSRDHLLVFRHTL